MHIYSMLRYTVPVLQTKNLVSERPPSIVKSPVQQNHYMTIIASAAQSVYDKSHFLGENRSISGNVQRTSLRSQASAGFSRVNDSFSTMRLTFLLHSLCEFPSALTLNSPAVRAVSAGFPFSFRMNRHEAQQGSGMSDRGSSIQSLQTQTKSAKRQVRLCRFLLWASEERTDDQLPLDPLRIPRCQVRKMPPVGGSDPLSANGAPWFPWVFLP